MARQGLARRGRAGQARLGAAGLGGAGQGWAWQAWHGTAWRGVAGQGLARQGSARPGRAGTASQVCLGRSTAQSQHRRLRRCFAIINNQDIAMGQVNCESTCIVCGQPILPGRKVCSAGCKGALAARFTRGANVVHEIFANFQPKPASWWTYARPGSQEKIEVLRWRYEHGEELFHPNDVTLLDEPHV